MDVYDPGVVDNGVVARPTAQQWLHAALRDRVGPALRSRGFKGSAPAWTLTHPSGDRAIVNVQSSDASSSQEVMFTVNTSVIPRAWWRWINHELGTSESRPAKQYHGLCRQRLNAQLQQASSRPEWWSVIDEGSAIRACDDVVNQLDHGRLQELQRLLQPGSVLDAARSGRLPGATYDTRGVLAVLLTDKGSSDELDKLLTELETLVDSRLRSTFWPIMQWCREVIN